MKNLTLPPCWTIKDVYSTRMPMAERAGDLKYDGKYCYRGIPFQLPLNLDINQEYALCLNYWNPYIGEWVKLGQVDTTKGVYSDPIMDMLNPVIDILIGINKQICWK